MSFLTITSPQRYGRFYYTSYEQLRDFYRIPRFVNDPYLVDLSAVTSNVFLGYTAENYLILAYFRPIYLNNKLVIESDIMLSNDNCVYPPKQLCQVWHPGVPVHASFSRSRVLTLVFMLRHNKAIGYQLAVFFPYTFSHKFDCSKTPFKSFYVFDPQPQPMLAYVLPSGDAALHMSNKAFKIDRTEIGKQSEASERFLVLSANESAIEYSVQYSYYDINPDLKNSQNKELLTSLNKQYSLALRSIYSFGIISQVKAVATICNNESLHSEICFMSFDCHSTDFVVLTKETAGAPRGMLHCKLYLHKYIGIVDKQTSIKLLQTFTTPYLPLTKYQFYYFDSMDLVSGTVRARYQALSALSNVLTFEFVDAKEAKITLIAIHLHIGSIIQIALPSCLYLKNKVSNPQFDQCEQAELVVQFLVQSKRITTIEVPEYTDMYQALFAKSGLTKAQPYVAAFAHCFAWIVPNYATGRMNICIIKALPYTPMEKIFDTSIPLTYQRIAYRIRNFAVGNDASGDAANMTAPTMYDAPLNVPPNKEIAFDIDCSVLGSVESTQDYVGLPSESQITEFECNNTSSAMETDDSIFQSIVEDGYDQSTTSVTSPVSSLIVSEQIRRKSKQALFKDQHSIPIFSQQELSTYLILNFIFKDRQLIFAPNNYLFYKRRFYHVTQPCNNIFYYIEFFKAIKQDALETFEYLSSPYSEIALFAVSYILFTHRLFDTADLTLKYISLHPKTLLENNINLIRQQGSSVYYNTFSQLLRFLTEMIQQIVYMYKVYLGEFMNIVRLIWGSDVCSLVQAFYDGSQGQDLIYALFDWYIGCFESIQSSTQIYLLPSMLLSIFYFSSVVKRISTQYIDRAGDIQPLPFEHYISEYLAYQQALARMGLSRKRPRIYKLTYRPSIVDWSVYPHPIARQYCSNYYLAQSMFKWFLYADNVFMAALNLASDEAIKHMTQQFDDLTCYRVFDRNFNQIITLIRHMNEAYSRKQYKEAQAEVNQYSAGATVMWNLARQSAVVNRHLQQFLGFQKLYCRFMSSNSFYLQLATISELVEAVQVSQNYADVISANENVAKHNLPFFPQWLSNVILTEFNDNDLALQAGFQYVELGDIDRQMSIIDEHYYLLYNRSCVIQPLEYQLLSDFRPIALKKRQERLRTRLRAGSTLKSSSHMLVKWALQEYQQNEDSLQQNLHDLSTFEQISLVQQYELFSYILKGESQIVHFYQKLAESLPSPCQSGSKLLMKAGTSVEIVSLRLTPFAKQRVLSFYQRAGIFEFQRAGKAVNKDEYYQILSTQGYESMYAALGSVGLYIRDFDEKRKVGVFLRGQFAARDFAKVVEQLIDDHWE